MNILIYLSGIWIISEILLSRLLRRTDPEKDHDRSSLKILWITIGISIVSGILLSRTNLAISSGNGLILYYLGIICIGLGLIVRWSAIIKLRKFFTVNVTVSEEQKIIRSGMYKYIRRPAYTGSLLSFLGLSLVFNNWITFLIIFFPVVMAFLYRIRIEEAVLCAAFGDRYKDYMNHSRRLIPWLY